MIQRILFLLIISSSTCLADTSSISHQENFRIHFPHLNYNNDSSLTNFQIYLPEYQSNNFPKFNGNFGGPMIRNSRSLELLHQENSGLTVLSQYELDPFHNKINLRENKFSKLNYNIGSKQEQRLRIQHHQRAAKGLNVGIDFNVLGSPGFYTRQFNKHRNLDVYTIYNSSNNKYSIEGHYISNKLESEENAGIIDDSLFIKADNLDANLVGINLNNATSRFQSRIYSIQQSFGLLGSSDTSASNFKKQYHLRLHHDFFIERTHRLFEVSSFATNYFDNFYRDSVSTKDSLFLRNFINEFGITYSNHLQRDTSLLIRYRMFAITNRHDYRYYLYDRAIERTMYDIRLGADLLINEDLSFSGYFDQGIENSKETKLHVASAITLFDDKMGLAVSYDDESQRTSLVSREFSSNHFVWSNDFNLIERSTIKALLNLKNIVSVRASQQLISNYVYYSKEGIPQQYSKEITNYQMDISSKQSVGKFNFRETLRLEDTDHPEIMPVPDLSAYVSTYFQSTIFKKKFPIQVGFDWRYNTAYYEREYNPATMQYQLQDQQEIGDYLYVDLFFNFRIKSARMFMKMQHINEGLSDRNYFLVPYQPMPGRAFRFGLEWKFND